MKKFWSEILVALFVVFVSLSSAPILYAGEHQGKEHAGTEAEAKKTEDTNGNGVLDEGEDLNGNGVIDELDEEGNPVKAEE